MQGIALHSELRTVLHFFQVLIAVAVLAFLMFLSSCTVTGQPGEPSARIMLDDVAVCVYVADDPDERSQGLQGYDPLAGGEGMVFIFEEADVRTFAMKDVTFPIDVIFVSEDMTVSSIIPLNPGDDRHVSSPGLSRYVIELPQGWAEENGIGVGSTVAVSQSMQ